MFQNYAAKLRKCQLRLQMAAIRRAVVGACTAVMLTLLFVLILYGSGAQMIKLSGIGHVLLRVADQEASKRFYRDILGFRIAEEEPEHGGVFMTLGESFHTLDIGQHPNPKDAPRPQRGQIGLAHIAFQVGSYAALRDAYAHLLENGVEIMRATNHVNQRSIYFADPDGNVLEIYYEMPHALELFANGRSDEDEALPVSGRNDPLPQWLLEDWPAPEMKAKIEELRRQKERATGA
jgi:catechol 2,3-dioxygenase-like lactoylglutathione lyase family enzyme